MDTSARKQLIDAGGYFHFSSEYGLAADNVKNFEVRAFDL